MDLTKVYSSFSQIQSVAKWAAVVGGIQSVSWIILSIISILLYFCVFDLDPILSYGSITHYVLFEMYFRGNCELDRFTIDFTHLNSVSTVLDSTQILIWACVYLGVSVVWLIGCILLMTRVTKSNLDFSVAVLYSWAFITFVTCCMDLALGIIFGIDFGQYQAKAYHYTLMAGQGSGVYLNDLNLVQLVSAEFSALFMMIVAFKGFVLWLINIGLMIYVMIGAYVAKDTVTDFINHAFNSTHASPLHAFEPKEETGFDNSGFVVEHRPHKSPIELNDESIKRAARMSTDNLQERRFRNIDSFEQYPPTKLTQIPHQHQPQQNLNHSWEPTVPAPDYTPPMPRANQNGHIRHSRYQ